MAKASSGLIVATLSLMALGCTREPGGSQSAIAPASKCVVIAFGEWYPTSPYWVDHDWSTVSPPQQLYTTKRWAYPSGQLDWRDFGIPGLVGSERTQGGQSVDPTRYRNQLWMWRAEGDSTWFLDPAALDEGLEVRGKWIGDTLNGRVHGFTDMVSPSADPRADARAIGFPCQERVRRDNAHRSLMEWRRSNRADIPRAQAEARQEEAFWRALVDSLRFKHDSQ
jgi:hypothetical protein